MSNHSKIGFYEQEITPTRKTFLAGYASRTTPMDGIQDPLYLRIMTMTDCNGQQAVIVTADIITFSEALSWRIKGWVEAELNIPSANVILNASHTHYGPLLEQRSYALGWTIDIDYLNKFEADIKNGIRRALNEASEREIYYGFTDIKLGVNRRFKDETGRVMRTMRPNLTGFYDSQVPVMAIYEAKKLIAVFYSFNCHPTSQNINMVSADYPGAISRAIKNIFGNAIHTIFAQGTGASAKVRFYNEDTLTFRPATITELDELGKKTAQSIAELINSNKMHRLELAINGQEKEFLLPYDRNKYLTQQQLLALATAESDTVDPVEKRWAATIYEANRNQTITDGFTMHATRLRLNDKLSIIGLSGEITGEVGALVKKLFPDESVICLGYCTKTDGYIPTAAMLPEGGYEAEAVGKYFGWPAPFAPNIDQIMQHEIDSFK